MPRSTIFISYGREDTDAARRLYSSLLEAGLDPWLDIERLKPGQQWRLEIGRAIRECRYFVVLLSSRTCSRRGFVHKELTDALDILDSYPDSEIYLIPVRLDECDPPRERLRDLHWTDMFPDWQTGIKKLQSCLVLETSNSNQTTPAASESPLQMLLEKYRDSTLAATQAKTLAAELYFSVRNVGSNPVVVFDLGLEEVNAGSATVPMPHAMSHRVKLNASLARKGLHGETIPLFSCYCQDCYIDADFLSPFTQDVAHEAILTFPKCHEHFLFFHSIVGPDQILRLAPGESESFLLTMDAEAGCTKVAAMFRLCCHYHGISGAKEIARSPLTFSVDLDRKSSRVRLVEP